MKLEQLTLLARLPQLRQCPEYPSAFGVRGRYQQLAPAVEEPTLYQPLRRCTVVLR